MSEKQRSRAQRQRHRSNTRQKSARVKQKHEDYLANVKTTAGQIIRDTATLFARGPWSERPEIDESLYTWSDVKGEPIFAIKKPAKSNRKGKKMRSVAAKNIKEKRNHR